MEAKHDTSQKQVPNDHLANERTLLAWIRTGIAIMAFGFVVVKFSLFVRQLAFLLTGREAHVPVNQNSGVFGVIIVVIGALSMVISYIKYKQTEKQLLNNNYRTSSKLILILILSLLVMSVFDQLFDREHLFINKKMLKKCGQLWQSVRHHN